MSSVENRPPGFENYSPNELSHSSYLYLTKLRRDVLDGLILQSVEGWPDQDPCKIIQEATGITRLAIATGLVSLVRDETLCPGTDGVSLIINRG